MRATHSLLLIAAGALLSSCVYYTPTVADMPYNGSTRTTNKYPNTWVTQPPASTRPDLQPALEHPTPALPPLGRTTAAQQPAPAPVAKPAPPVAAPAPAKPAAAPAKPVAAPAKPVAAPAKPAAAPAKSAAKPAEKPVTKPLDLTKPVTPVAPKPEVTPAPKPTEPTPKTEAPAPKTEEPAPKPAETVATPKPAAASADPKSITNQGPIPVATRVEGDPTRVYNPLDPSKTIRVTDKNGQPYPKGKELKVRGTNFHFYVP